MSEISPRAPERRTSTNVHFKDQEGIEFGNISFNQSGTFDKTGFEGTLSSNSITFAYEACNPTIFYIKGTIYTTETELITFYPHSGSGLAEATVEILDEYLDEKTLQFRIVCEKLSVDETWSISYTKATNRVTRTGSASFEITSATENATIYYTIDGTEPTTESSVYSSSISTTENITVKALATRKGLLNSNITSTDIKVKLPAPEITQEINGDTGTLSLSNSYDSYEGVSFEVGRQESEDYFVTRVATFPYEVTSNDTYIFQAISAGKNVNSNKIPVEVTELKASDPSIDVDDPEGSFKIDVAVGGVPEIPAGGSTLYKTAICTGLIDWLNKNTEAYIPDESAGVTDGRKGVVVTLKRPDNIEESYYLEDINLAMEGKPPVYCYENEEGIWVIVLASWYTIMIYPAGGIMDGTPLENETIIFADNLNTEGTFSLTFSKDIDSVSYMKNSFEMTLTTGGATAMGPAASEFIGWSGNDFLYWLMYNTATHQGTGESSSTYMLDGISVSIKDGDTFNKTFDQLITDPEADVPEGKLGIAYLSRDDAGSLVYKDSGKTNMFYLLFRGYVGADENPLNMDTVYLGTPDLGLVAPITITFTKNEEATSDDEFVVNMTKNPDLTQDDMNMIPTAVATGLSDWITEKATTIDTADIQGGGLLVTNIQATIEFKNIETVVVSPDDTLENGGIALASKDHMAAVSPADGRFIVYLFTQASDSIDYAVKDFCYLYPTDFDGLLAADEVTITFKVIGAQ